MKESKIMNPDQTFEEALKLRAAAFGGEDEMAWIYKADIGEVWKAYVDHKKVE